jgi:hypothetical protein
MTKRKELQQKRARRARQRQLGVIGVVVAVALALIGYSVYQNTRPIGSIVQVEKESYPFADGKTLGSKDAPVVVQEFSDFQ